MSNIKYAYRKMFSVLILFILVTMVGGHMKNIVYAASNNYNFIISKEIANIPLNDIDTVSINTKDCRLLIEENPNNSYQFGYFGNSDESDFQVNYYIDNNKLNIDITSTEAYKQDLENPQGILIKIPKITYKEFKVKATDVPCAFDLENIKGNLIVELVDANGDFYSESIIDCNLTIKNTDSYVLLTSKESTSGTLNIDNKDGKIELVIQELLADINLNNEFGRVYLNLLTIPKNMDFNIDNHGKMTLPVDWSSSYQIGTKKPTVKIVNESRFELSIKGIRPND